MSLHKLTVVLFFVFPMVLCKAQTAPARPIEPTAIGVVYHLDPTSQELKKLPDEQWKEQGGFNGYRTYIKVSGKSSSFRVKADEKGEFVFNTGSPEKVSLYRFTEGGKRQFEFKKLTMGGTEFIKGLPVEVSKYGESSYKLVPASPLAPGEYAIIIAEEVYTFGVD